MSDGKRYWFVIGKGKLEYVQDLVTGEKITVSELEDLVNDQQAEIENLRKWVMAEQKQVGKSHDFIKQKGLMREFVKELQDECEKI